MTVKKKTICAVCGLLLLLTCGFCGCSAMNDLAEQASEELDQAVEEFSEEAAEDTAEETEGESTGETAAEKIGLTDVYGGEWYYSYTCNGEEFYAQYTYDNWTLFDSYKITSTRDMKTICQALIDTHPVHGRDYESFRTVNDMVYEWKQHNLAYKYLPEDNSLRNSAQNVDFDPEDQGRSFKEFYEDRTGEEFDLEKIIKEKLLQ